MGCVQEKQESLNHEEKQKNQNIENQDVMSSYRNSLTEDIQQRISSHFQSNLVDTNSEASLLLIEQQCVKCLLVARTNFIVLPCQHAYHPNCLSNLTVSQLKQKQTQLKCVLCSRTYSHKIFNNQKYSEALFKNQLSVLQQKYPNLVKCSNCKFIFYKDNNYNPKLGCSEYNKKSN